MSSIYETTPTVVTTTGANEIVELPFPGRCELTKISIVRLSGNGITVDLFSRAFASDPVQILNIRQTPEDTTIRVTLQKSSQYQQPQLALKVGDPVTLTGGTYAGDRRVLAIVDEFTFDLSGTYTVDEGTVATIELNIQTVEQPLYRVLPQQTDAGASLLVIPPSTGNVVNYVNQDPQKNTNTGFNRKIYLRFAAAASYRVVLGGDVSVGA